MLSPKRLAALLPRIIGGLARVLLLPALLLPFVLAGCSTTRLGYNNAPRLVYWWLDSYIDFTAEQSQPVRDSLAALHSWHRRSELPAYADLLHQAQRLAAEPVTPEQVCAITAQVHAFTLRLGDQAADGLSQLVPTLKPEQLRHLAYQFDKHNQQWREEWLDDSPEELAARRLKKGVERAEKFYGRLDEPQLAVLRKSVATSSFDVRLAWAERLRRQRDMLRAFEEHSGGDRATHVKAEMMALLRRTLEPPDPEYRRQFERVLQESCQTIAALHNSASAAQRRTLVETLQAYEADVRALAADLPEAKK